MRHIVVPLDGTPFAESALPLARRLAHRAGADLVLARVYAPPVPVGAVDELVLVDPGPDPALRQRAQAYLDDVVRRSASMTTGTPVRGALLDGPPARAIHALTMELGAAILVMASHARSGLARVLVGSVTNAVVREGGVPVLVVPMSERRLDAAVAPPLRHLLVALDGTVEAEAVVTPALVLARLLDSAVTLVHVRDTGDARKRTLLPTALLDTADIDPTAYLDAVARRLAAGGATVATRTIDGHPIADRLLDAARELAADWLAMSTHARGLWARLLVGSVAEAVLERAMMPVLLVHPTPGTVPPPEQAAAPSA